jgi:RimJ/RimL family protein N-acetyltransferase
VNPAWELATGRLRLCPVSAADLAELTALKADPRVFAVMLGGVRTPEQTVRELAEEVAFWGAHAVGMWSVRLRADGRFLGITGFMERADGLGIALRFAFRVEAQGRGFASEAAGAALQFAHVRAGLARVVAVARADNFASRQVLGSIGMHLYAGFEREGTPMLVYESLAEV